MRRVGALAPLLLLVAGLALGGPAAPAAAASGVQIDINTLTPAVATPESTLQVAGTITNSAKTAVRNGSVRLLLSTTRLGSRSELAAVEAGKVTDRDGEVVAEEPLSDLGPGESTPFDLHEELAGLATAEFGVYPLAIEVVGSLRGAASSRLALARTLLPWVSPEHGISPTGFNWVWPLVGTPVRLANGRFADDSLAASLAPGGRLDRLVEAGARLDQGGAAVTWAIDPDLVQSVEDMADGYRVATPDGGTVAGGGAGLAVRWLDALRAATAGSTILSLPYADPDVVALGRHGQPGEVVRARDMGKGIFAAALPAAQVTEKLSWPPGGFVNRATLGALARAGDDSVILDGSALPPAIDQSFTPSGRAEVASPSGSLVALLADPTLTQLLTDAADAPDPLLAGQRVLAETAMITSEQPNAGVSRTVVVVPPRRWDPPAEFLGRISDAATAPWQAPVSLRELTDSHPANVDRDALRYPAAARRAELPEPYLRALDTQRGRISNLAAILTNPGRVITRLQDGLLRSESSWWRGRDIRVNRLSRDQTYLAVVRGRVRVQPGNFTFGSKSGNIPITLVNDLPQEVVVVLRLQPQTPRLRLGQVEPRTIGPHQKVQVNVPASAVAGGPVVVDATLHTIGGAQYGQPVTLRVTVTQIGTVALVITVGAAVVLFLAAGVRVVRRMRAAARDTAEPDGAEAPEDVHA